MERNKSNERKFTIKTYSLKEVAELYEIDTRTLVKWIDPFEKEIGKRIGYFYTPKQIKIITDKLGIPHIIDFN